jgi:hypothetical protein
MSKRKKPDEGTIKAESKAPMAGHSGFVTARTRAAELSGRVLLDAGTQVATYEMKDWVSDTRAEFIVLAGRRRTGKSWWIRDYLHRYRHNFAYGYIFTHTKANNFYQQFFPNDLILSEFRPDVLHKIFEMQLARLMVRGQSNDIFIVFDDVISKQNIRYVDDVVKLATEGRHYNITVLFSTQHYKGVGPTLRLNADKMVVFTVFSRGVIQSLREEFGFMDFVDEPNFIAWVEKNTEDNQCIVINSGDTTLRGIDRWMVYKARDLSEKKFSLLCDRAWQFKRGQKLAEQRGNKLPGVMAASTAAKVRSRSVVTQDEMQGRTKIARLMASEDPFGFVAD